ncbi:hypothetical protein B0H12DRAFT_1101854 [Mycena haematopus]|nr:hypothetical protein B0H12DRAFT_1101854 [Mycena haematopus]
MAQNGYYPLMFLCSLRCPLTMKPSLGSRTTCIVVGGSQYGSFCILIHRSSG